MRFEVRLAGKRLAAAVILVLAALLALAATMAQGTGAGPMNAEGIAQAIDAEKDHVTPGELARWILDKRQDYQLIDIRPPWQFDDYRIPTAINIPLAALFQDAGWKQLSRGKKVVLYGFGAGHAAQAQLLLTMKGYQAFSLRDGITDWWLLIMTPSSLRSDEPNPAGYRESKQLREQFMGAPATGRPAAPQASPQGVQSAPPAAAPQGKPAPTPANKLKLGQGCS
jgi:sulfur-carrier protein adenylyltransferase/sulfurtransferase